ncbi:hypothetical protein Tco_0008257 [Tanacetum coccineum]
MAGNRSLIMLSILVDADIEKTNHWTSDAMHNPSRPFEFLLKELVSFSQGDSTCNLLSHSPYGHTASAYIKQALGRDLRDSTRIFKLVSTGERHDAHLKMEMEMELPVPSNGQVNNRLCSGTRPTLVRSYERSHQRCSKLPHNSDIIFLLPQVHQDGNKLLDESRRFKFG